MVPFESARQLTLYIDDGENMRPRAPARPTAGNLIIIYTSSFISIIITVGVAKWFPRRSQTQAAAAAAFADAVLLVNFSAKGLQTKG